MNNQIRKELAQLFDGLVEAIELRSQVEHELTAQAFLCTRHSFIGFNSSGCRARAPKFPAEL